MKMQLKWHAQRNYSRMLRAACRQQTDAVSSSALTVIRMHVHSRTTG